MNINKTAFLTTTSLGVATIGASLKAAAAISTVSTVAFTALAILGAALSTAAITSYFAAKAKALLNPEDDTSATFFETMQTHAGFAVTGAVELVSKALVQGLIDGIVKGVTNAISRKIGGPDHTHEVKHSGSVAAA